jgi:hypothetical protein
MRLRISSNALRHAVGLFRHAARATVDLVGLVIGDV